MVTYKKLTYDGSKVQVESAIRDGNGKRIDTNYALKSEIPTNVSQLTNDSGYTTNTGTVTTTGTITANQIPLFNANSSTVLKQSGVTIATSLTTTSDANVPTSKAVATYVTGLGYGKGTLTKTGSSSANQVALWNGTDTVLKAVNQSALAPGVSIATDSGTSAITLAHNTKYKLTVGASSVIFTTPPNSTDTDAKTSSANSTSKLFLVGATTQSSSGVTTYSNSAVYATNGALNATSFTGTDVTATNIYPTKIYFESGNQPNILLTADSTVTTSTAWIGLTRYADGNKAPIITLEADSSAGKIIQTTSAGYNESATGTTGIDAGWTLGYVSPSGGAVDMWAKVTNDTAGTMWLKTSGTITANNSYAVTGGTVASALAGYVPTSRTINSKALTGNISLTASDVSALASNTTFATINGTSVKSNSAITIQANVQSDWSSTSGLSAILNKPGTDNTTTVGSLVNLTSWANSTNLVTRNVIAYWDGRYQTTNNSSNLAYVKKGALGDACIKGVDSSISAGSTSTNLPTSSAVASFVEGKGYTTNTGTVTTTGTMTSGHIVVSNGGTVIKDSGYTIAKSVPSNAVFTDTTYSVGVGLTLSGTSFSETFPVYYARPNETTATATLTATISNFPTAYADGIMIALRMPFNNSASSTLNVNGLGAKPVYYGNNTTTATRWGVSGCMAFLVYETTTVSTGCWKAVYSYDSNTTTTVRQTLQTGNYNLPLLMSYVQTSDTTGNRDGVSYRNNSIYANPSTGSVYATHLYKGTTEVVPVSFSRSLTSGTKIGTITIDGTATDLYCQTNTNTDTLVKQTAQASTTTTYPLLFSAQSSPTSGTAYEAKYSTNCYVKSNKLYSNGTEVSVTGHTHDYLPSSTTFATINGTSVKSNTAFTIPTVASMPFGKSCRVTPQSSGSIGYMNTIDVAWSNRWYDFVPDMGCNFAQVGGDSSMYTLIGSGRFGVQIGQDGVYRVVAKLALSNVICNWSLGIGIERGSGVGVEAETGGFGNYTVNNNKTYKSIAYKSVEMITSLQSGNNVRLMIYNDPGIEVNEEAEEEYFGFCNWGLLTEITVTRLC